MTPVIEIIVFRKTINRWAILAKVSIQQQGYSCWPQKCVSLLVIS